MKNVTIVALALAALALLALAAPEGEIREEQASPAPIRPIHLNVDRCYADPH